VDVVTGDRNSPHSVEKRAAVGTGPGAFEHHNGSDTLHGNKLVEGIAAVAHTGPDRLHENWKPGVRVLHNSLNSLQHLGP